MTNVSDQIAMTLAGIAYGAPERIAGYLGEAELLGKAWQLSWLAAPADPPVNFAFIASSGDSHVLAIRGTYPNPYSPAYWADGDQDSPFGEMVAWPGAPDAKISAGTSTGFDNLLALTDANGRTIEQAAGALPAGATLTVTGHSLGGTLAPVLALHLAGRYPQLAIEVATFAGMTPGNSAFAALFANGTRLAGKVRRVYNTLDTVAYGWDQVWATHDFYQPAPQGGPLVAAMLLATLARLKLGEYDFAAVGTPVPLTGQVQPEPIPVAVIGYLLENLHQHMPDTYLELLGAPKLPFSILFGSIVAPRAAPVAASASPASLPVVHI